MVAQAEILSSPVVAEITSQKEIPEEKPLADSPYSCQWFVDTLTAKDPNFVELRRNHRVLNVNAVNISGGKGFISKVYKCEVELEGVEREYEIILKVPGMDAIESVKDNIKHDGEETKDEEEKKVAHFAAFHNKECSFYENYAAGIEGFPLVKMFDTHRWIVDETRGYLLMESMVGKADTQSIFSGFTKSQALKIGTHLAHFHKHFLTMEDKSWEKQFPLELFQDDAAFDFIGALLKKLVAMKPEVFEDRINHVLEFSNTRKFHDYTSHSIYQEIGLPAVLVHGDLWCNNIMWKNDSEEVAAFIDFQLTHTGSPAFDIARVLVLCADGDIRREHAHAVLEHYFSTLTELMAKEGKPVGFTMDQLERAYNVHLVNQTIHLLFMVPFFCCGDHDEKMKPVWEARTEKMMMRALFALDDALEILKTIPEEKYKP